MTKRSSKRWQDFERDRILGGFASHKPTREFRGNANELDALLNGSTGSRPANDDREAIERGEDEGMSLGPK